MSKFKFGGKKTNAKAPVKAGGSKSKPEKTKPEKKPKPEKKKKPEKKSKESKTTSSVNSVALRASNESGIRSERMTSKDSSGAKPKRSKLPVIILLFFILALLAGLGAVIYLNYFHKPSEKKSTVCISPKCVQLAHQLNNWGDPNADPCVDFYKFSCGKFIEHTMATNTHLSYQKEIVSNFMDARFTSDKTVPKTNAEKAMRIFYNACQAGKPVKLEDALRQKMQKIYTIMPKMGPWPALIPPDGSPDPFQKVNFVLNDWLTNIAEAGFSNPFFSFVAFKKVVIMGPDSYPQDDVLIKWAVTEMLQTANLSGNLQMLDDDIAQARQLNAQIMKLSRPGAGSIPFATLKEKVKRVDFEKVLTTLANLDKSKWDQLSSKIVVSNAALFFGDGENLETIIGSTSKRVLANYVAYSFIYEMLIISTMGSQESFTCGEFVADVMPQAVLQLFIRSHKNEENIEQFSKMLAAVKESYAKMFDSSNWLGGPTKEKSKRKLEMMTELVSYPNEQALDKLYEKVKLTENDGLAKVFMNLGRTFVAHSFDNVIASSKSPLYEGSLSRPGTVNDHFAITVAILNDANFNVTYPKYARVADAGTTLAHEIGHGFDGEGVQMDGDGDLNLMMTKEELEKFKKKHECLLEQYKNYEDPDYGHGLDGKAAITDLFADNVAAVVAWKTHKSFDMSKEPEIVGFKGKDVDKMFFHIAALDFCAPPMSIPKDQVAQMTSPTHSFRVNGPFANMESFAKTFGCKSGTAMNPSKKCEIF